VSELFIRKFGVTPEEYRAGKRRGKSVVKIEKERAARPLPPPKPHGVGWHLRQLLEGITVEGCSCKSVAALADRLGPDGCRERKADLAAKLGEALAKLTGERLAAVTAKLQALGGVEWLIDESIRRAEHGNQHEGQRDGQKKEQAPAAHHAE